MDLDPKTAPTRSQLSDERDRINDQLTQMGHGKGPGLEFEGGFADVGQITAERGEVDALAASLSEVVAEIEDALAKLDNGTYGKCEACSIPIGEARLEAMPAARLCIDCATHRR